ncbi:MAG: hypothetical protein V4635_11010 [Bacteroidota bacterium]
MRSITPLILALILLGKPLMAQKNNFSLVFGYGPGYIFNDKTISPKVSHSGCVGIKYLLSLKNQSAAFNPGISLQRNIYNTRITGESLVHIRQTMVNLNLDVLLKIRKKIFLKAGISISHMASTDVLVILRDVAGQHYYSFGNAQVYKNYYPSALQAGVNTGIGFSFGSKREQKLFACIFHTASSLVDADYVLDKALVGRDIRVLSKKSRPTLLIITWEISLRKTKQNKTKESEE